MRQDLLGNIWTIISGALSGSFLTQDGIVGGNKSNFTRFTNSASYNLDLLKNFKFKSGITLTRTNKRNLLENTLGSVLFNALNMAPNIPCRYYYVLCLFSLL